MIKINKNNFLLEDAYEDIDDSNTIYLYFTNNNGVDFMEVREGNIEDFSDNNSILTKRKFLLEKADFTDNEWKTLMYCYNFWFDSDNGLNCFIEPDIYKDEDFTKEDFISLFNKLNTFDKEKFPEIDQIEFEDGNENGAICVYPSFIQLFNDNEARYSYRKASLTEEIKFILIDPFNDETNLNGEVVQIEPNLENYYKLLDCKTIDITTRYIGGKPYDIIVDDEGLLKENNISCINPASYLIPENYRQNDLLAGKVLITKYDEESGKNISLSNEDIKNIQNHIQNNVLIMYFQENEEKEIIDEGSQYGLDCEVINNFFSDKAKTIFVSSNNFESNYELSEDDFINE